MEGLRDWLAGLSRRELILLAIVGIGLVAGAGLWYVRSLPKPVEVRAGPVAAPSPTSDAAPVFVHVAGLVRRPGVYELRQGDRVIDAIDAAGGPRKGAHLDALNLAAVLTDGQQVVVPKRVPGGGPPATAPAGSDAGGEVAQKINLNTATAEELEELPGIGEVLSQRIVDYRDDNGPFGSVDELIDVSGIGEVTMEELRDLVTV